MDTLRDLARPSSRDATHLPTGDSPRAPSLRVGAVTGEAELAALERPWRALFAAAGNPTPFQSYDWQATWWKHHGHGRLWILTGWDGDALVALLPLTVTPYRGTPLRQVRFMGAPLSDVQDILCLPKYAAWAARAFLGRLADESERWDLCDLPDQRRGSPLTTVTPPERLRIDLVHHRVCPYLPLPPSWDELLGGLGTHMRSNVKRRRKNLQKQFAVEYFSATDPAGVPAAMQALFRLHGARWRRRGVSGAFAGETMQQFHLEIAQRFAARGWLALHLLRLDGEPVAAFYGFRHRQRVYHYLGGFDPRFSRFGPGVALHSYAIEQAIRSGATEFDMLRGDETYKYYWRCAERDTQRLVIGTASLRSTAARELHRFERFAEHRGLALQRRFWGGQGPKSRSVAAPSQRQ